MRNGEPSVDEERSRNEYFFHLFADIERGLKKRLRHSSNDPCSIILVDQAIPHPESVLGGFGADV